MNILVTGANGQLGNAMRIVASSSADRYIFTDVTTQDRAETSILDITDMNAIRQTVRDGKVDVIVNCAAYTNVDAAESNAALAERLNAEAPENLAKAMKETGGWLVHISTDYVFGKEPYNTPCKEDQKGTPTGVYGRTKKDGEERIMRVFGEMPSAPHAERNGGYVIIRTAWLYSEFGKNFCKTMLGLTASKPQLRVVFDQCGTPTYALDLANAISEILKKPQEGIFHFSNEGVCSWYDFTKMIQEYSGNVECDVRPCHSCEFPSPVTRPSYSVLDKTKIKDTFGLEIPYWTDSLKKCIANLKNNSL